MHGNEAAAAIVRVGTYIGVPFSSLLDARRSNCLQDAKVGVLGCIPSMLGPLQHNRKAVTL